MPGRHHPTPMATTALARLAPILGAALALPCLLAAQTPDARENGDPVATFWSSGMTPSAVAAQVSQGWRITDLQIDSTSPWLFTVAMAHNSGSNAIPSTWNYGTLGGVLATTLQQGNSRLIDLEPYDDGTGLTRFAYVAVSNTGANNKAWGWLYDATPAAISNLVSQGNRIVDLEQYTVGGQTKYACVTISNSGADARGWWYYYGQSQSSVASLLAANNARIYDIDRVGSLYNVVMIGASNQPKTWRYYGLTTTQVTDELSQIGARMFDVNRYTTASGARYDVAFVNNSNALSTRISEHLRANTDGDSGVLLKRVDGAELAYINGDRPHEPGQALMTLHHVEAMRRVSLGTTTLTTPLTTYPTTISNCPSGSGVSVVEPLQAVLAAMMENDQTPRCRTVTDNFGGFTQLNARAAALGMTSTQVNHHIGCLTPANQTTLRDMSRLHEQVANGYLGSAESSFYGLMADGFGQTGYANGRLDLTINEEAAAAGLTASQTANFVQRLAVYHKDGAYTVGALHHRSWAAYVRIPFVVAGQVVQREYTVGSFVDGASTANGAGLAADIAAAEALRDEIAAALATWAGVAIASSTAVGVGCGAPAATQLSVALPVLGAQTGFALTNGYPGSPALFGIGFSSTSANGVPLPFDLSLVGALPGCSAYNDLAITSAHLTNLSGATGVYLQLPSDLAFAGFTFFTQWYSFDGTGQQPFKASNGRRNVVGL
jgi:hypothetical protein